MMAFREVFREVFHGRMVARMARSYKWLAPFFRLQYSVRL